MFETQQEMEYTKTQKRAKLICKMIDKLPNWKWTYKLDDYIFFKYIAR